MRLQLRKFDLFHVCYCNTYRYDCSCPADVKTFITSQDKMFCSRWKREKWAFFQRTSSQNTCEKFHIIHLNVRLVFFLIYFAKWKIRSVCWMEPSLPLWPDCPTSGSVCDHPSCTGAAAVQISWPCPMSASTPRTRPKLVPVFWNRWLLQQWGKKIIK